MRFEIWDKLECAGGVVLKVIPDAVNMVWVDSKDGQSSLTGQIPIDSPAFLAFGTSRILRVIFENEDVLEMVIQDLTPSMAANAQLMCAFACVPIDALLNQVLLRQVYADGSVATDFELTALTPAQWIDSIVLTSAAAEGMSWLARGTVESTFPQDFNLSAETIRTFLGKLASGCQPAMELRFRRNGAVGYLIDLIAQIGRGATALDLRANRNLIALSRKSSRTGQVTRCSVQGTAIDSIHPTMARARWSVVTTPGGSTLTVADPAGGDGPIAFDSQYVLPTARYIRKIGGSPILLTASTAATQGLSTSGAHGLAPGDLIEFVADASGTDLTFVEHPTKVAQPPAGYGLVTAMLDRPDLAGTINLVVDPCFKQYPTSPGLPTQYQLEGGMVASQLTRVATQGLWLSGGQSCRMQTTGDGQGLGTLYTPLSPLPSAARPYVSAFVDYFNNAPGSSVRAELILGKATIAVSGTPTRATVGTITTVIVPTTGAHGLAEGAQIEITGATPAGYNVSPKPVHVIDATHFSYTLDSDPGAPGGTWVARPIFVFPDQGVEYSSEVGVWDTLGIAGIHANILGATVARIRLVQHGTTNVDAYIDGSQITRESAQEPFLEGSGPNRMVQVANRKLAVFADPVVTYDIQIIDLNRLEPGTWPYDTIVLGGTAKITHPGLGIADSVRIVEITRQLDLDKVTNTAVKLATRADEFTDVILPRTLRLNDASPGTVPTAVSAAITPIPGDPNTVTVTLTPSPQGAQVYYWIGQADQKPPLVGVINGSPGYSQTAWGLYIGPFAQARQTTGDSKVWTYCVIANRTSPVFPFQITQAITSNVVLALSQILPSGSGSNMRLAWTADPNVKSVQVYLKRVASPGAAQYPTTGAHGSTDPLDSAQYVGEFYTLADGTGITGALGPGGAGQPLAGALMFTPTTTFSTGDWLAVILVPIDRQGNVGNRVSATLQTVASTSTIATFTATKTNDGSACVSAGAQFTLAWTEGGTAWVDATHDLDLWYQFPYPSGFTSGWILAATEASPHSNHSRVVTVPHMVTTGKFDRLIAYQFKAELKIAGPTIIDTATVTAASFKSSCVTP